MLPMHLAALAFATTALATTGCGSSSKSSSTSASTSTPASTQTTTSASTTPTSVSVTVAKGAPLTRSALIQQGDVICARANAKTSVMTANSVQEFTRVYPQIAIYNRTEAAQLGKLVPPKQLAADWKAMIRDLELHAQYVSEVAQDIKQKNPSAGKHFEMANAVIQKLVETGKRDGFTHCSKLS